MMEGSMLMATSQPGWRTVALTTLAAIVAMVVFSITAERTATQYSWSDEVEHATGHAALGIPLLLLIVAALWRWPPPRPTRASRRARMLIIIGLAAVTAGQILESAGALGYSGNSRTQPALAFAHDIGIIAGPLGLLIVAGGLALVLHRPSASLGITDVAVIGVAMIGIAGLFIGFPAPAALLLMAGAIAIGLTRRLRLFRSRS
jgi:hypothetical protein